MIKSVCSIVLIFLFMTAIPCALADGKYLVAIKEVIKEIRPNPSFEELDKFLQTVPQLPANQAISKSAEQISDFLFKKLQIAADNSYLSRGNKDNILPDSVLLKKQGHCLGLTILFLLVAEKNNLNVQLVRGPDHVFPRICGTKKCVNIEMLRNGELKDDSYYIQNLQISKFALDRKLYLVGLDSSSELKASIYLGLGYVANNAGQRDVAELFYLKSVEVSPSFVEAHSNLAAIYAQKGQKQAALNELNKAIKINPSHYATLINLGIMEQSLGNKDKALAFYDKAIESNAMAVDAYRRRSKILFELKRWKQASLDLDRILIIQPRFCDVIEDRLAMAKHDATLAKNQLAKKLSDLKSESKCLLLPAN